MRGHHLWRDVSELNKPEGVCGKRSGGCGGGVNRRARNDCGNPTVNRDGSWKGRKRVADVASRCIATHRSRDNKRFPIVSRES